MVRIVSWNMDHWRRGATQRRASWGFLEALKPDYTLLQETVPPGVLPPGWCVYRACGAQGKGRWGSAVVSYGEPMRAIEDTLSPFARRKKPVSLHRTDPGCLAIADAGKGLVLISAYGAFDEGYAVTTVHRLLSDLTPLLDNASTRGVVLAGDLNLSTQVEAPHRARHRNALERFATLGLVDCLALDRPARRRLADCPCEDRPCRHVQTHRHPNSPHPWQDDYVFVSESLASRVVSCFVLDGGEPDPWQFSDHCPLVLELRL